MKLLPVFVGLALAACGSNPTPTTTTPHPAPPADADPTCPLGVPGTSLSLDDTGALVFVTTGDVAAVRAHAAELARVYGARAPKDAGLADAPCGDCLANLVDIPAHATATDVAGGSKVTFVATSPDRAADLKAALSMHAGHLAHNVGTCKMSM